MKEVRTMRAEERKMRQKVVHLYRVPTSSGNHEKPGKSQKKSSMLGKIIEFEKNLNNHGKIMDFSEIITRNISSQKTMRQMVQTHCV